MEDRPSGRRIRKWNSTKRARHGTGGNDLGKEYQHASCGRSGGSGQVHRVNARSGRRNGFLVLKMCSNSGKSRFFSEKFEVHELPKIEKCGVARAVEPIRAELSTNLSECESARALEPIHSESSAQAELKSTSDRVQNKHKGRPKGICETKTRPSVKRHERASYVAEVHLEPGFLVAYSHKLRCLHYIGRCWRKPGRDIKRWTYFGTDGERLRPLLQTLLETR